MKNYELDFAITNHEGGISEIVVTFYKDEYSHPCHPRYVRLFKSPRFNLEDAVQAKSAWDSVSDCIHYMARQDLFLSENSVPTCPEGRCGGYGFSQEGAWCGNKTCGEISDKLASRDDFSFKILKGGDLVPGDVKLRLAAHLTEKRK